MSISEPAGERGAGRQYRFGDFVLDLEHGFLRQGAGEVMLRRKSFEVLTYLVERHGRLVTKDELIEAVWPGTAVTDNSLAQCLLEIRRALGDRSQQAIRTVARRGYVFAAPLAPPRIEFGRVPAAEAAASSALHPVHVAAAPSRRLRTQVIALAVAVAATGALVMRALVAPVRGVVLTPLTDFSDSATWPALSPDGRVLAFFRSDRWFMTTDPIYVKMLPGGEATPLLEDRRQKYGLAFSPDGSQIAYGVNAASGYDTYVVPTLKGEPRLLLANAAALSWLDGEHLLFAEIKRGMHLGIVTSTRSRTEHREVYFPPHERAMAHYAHASPDRKWAVVVEMDERPVWLPCRLVPISGDSAGRRVGPNGYCTGAGWSPDGRWMYFTAAVDEQHHLWRQRFPDGTPEQLTFGPEQEDGVAVAPDGSLVTSIGIDRSAIWMRDAAGDRPLTSEGTIHVHLGVATMPSFSPDATRVYYVRRESAAGRTTLWRADVASGRSDPVLPGTAVVDYDVSPDGREVVFSTQPEGKPIHTWIAPVDGTSPPRLVASNGENSPHFGPDGEILFRYSENHSNYIGRMNRSGADRSRVAAFEISTFQRISPDRRWLIAITPTFDARRSGASTLVSTRDGVSRQLCARVCTAVWAPDGKLFYLTVESKSRAGAGASVALPVRAGTGLPDLPDEGFGTPADALALPGARRVPQADILPGLDPNTYAFVKTTTHRNLFRVRVR